MVKSCVAALPTEQTPEVVGEKTVVRKTGPAAKEEVIVKLYNSESRFRNEMRNAQRLWADAGAALKPHLGVPYFGARTTAASVVDFFKFKNGKIGKNKAALNLHSGDTFAFKVGDCEATLAGAKHENLFMTVSPKYETDLRSLLGKKSKVDKVEVLGKALGALAKLNEKSVWSDAFVDNIMVHDGRAMIIDLDYLREAERLFAPPRPAEDGRPPRVPRFGPAELVVPEALAFTLAAEKRLAPPQGAGPDGEAVPEEVVAPVYHPHRPGAALKVRVPDLPYAHPEGKTRTEWMRDSLLAEQAAFFPPEQALALVKPGGAVDALAAAFPADDAALAPLRLRYDPYRLAMSILLLGFDGGAVWAPADAVFVTRLLKGLAHPDVAQRLSAAEAAAWIDAYLLPKNKARPVVKKAPAFDARNVLPLPRPPAKIAGADVAAFADPIAAESGAEAPAPVPAPEPTPSSSHVQETAPAPASPSVPTPASSEEPKAPKTPKKKAAPKVKMVKK